MNVRPNIVSPVISNSTELKHEIMRLNSLKEEQEILIKKDLKEIYYSMQLSTIIKRTANDLVQDDHLKGSAVKTGIELGSGFLLDKLFLKKGYGIKSYLINAGLKKLLSFAFNNTRLKKLIQPEL